MEPISVAKYFSYVLFLILFVVPSSGQQAHANSGLSLDPGTGLFRITHNTKPVIKGRFLFWHGNWKWSELDPTGQLVSPGRYKLFGKSQKTGASLSGNVQKRSSREMTWRFKLQQGPAGKPQSWGGIAFDIAPNHPKQGTKPLEPVIRSDKSGWQLQLSPDEAPISIVFSPKPDELVFEQGQKNEIRAYFKGRRNKSKSVNMSMTITMPENGLVKPTLMERLEKPSKKNWNRNILIWDRSPVDLSFLNRNERPAGKHGFLKKTKNGRLIFEDGSPARFWGTNLTAYSLFDTDAANSCKQARRLSRLGFNLIRITHHDTGWVEPNVFGKNSDDTLKLQPGPLDRLDRWIKCLRDEGIYIWLDLLVERNFTNKDGITAFTEIAKGQHASQAKGFTYINKSLQKRMKQFNKAYLSHVNPYTSLAYKNDPAIVSLLLTNENDLTHHFGNSLLPDAHVPKHNRIYMSLAKNFARTHNLDYDKVWRSWEHGPSKSFLNDVEHRFNLDMLKHLRAAGVKNSIVTMNSWGGMSLAGLPSLTDGDMVAVNSYGVPNFLESNPRYQANLSHWIAAAGIVGRPLAVTEWNMEPFPRNDRYNLPTYMASIARLQDWDAMMHYAYSITGLDWQGETGNWNAFHDPAALAMMPAAALLFRKGHAKPAIKTFHLTLSPKQFLGKDITATTSRAIRTLSEQSKLRIAMPKIRELPWLMSTPPSKEAITITDPQHDFIPPGQNFVCSDTGEICRDWKKGIFTLDTKHSQMTSGWLGGKKVVLKDITVQLATKNASIAVQSLDGAPIRTSGKILISMASQARPVKENTLPFLSEPLKGRIGIRNSRRLKLYSLDPSGVKTKQTLKRKNGAYIIEPGKLPPTSWFLLQK